jgi:signal transduction histidine kinase
MTNVTEKPLDILIADDDEIDRIAIKRYLKNAGKQIVFHETVTGADTLSIMQSRPFDCVFLDYYLADMNGVAILKNLYDPEMGLTQSPVVMMTGMKSEEAMVDALRSGAQDYILKDNMSAANLNMALAKSRELYELKRSRHQAEAELHHVRKMEAIGNLTSGVAHDFNNLLTVVIGNAHILRRRLKGGFENCSMDDVDSKLDAIETVAQRGAELVRRLMIFSRQSTLAHEKVDVNTRIRNTVQILSRTLGSHIEIDTITEETVWPVFIDPGEFENMIINFAVNARDAMPAGGKLLIETHNVVLDDSYTLGHPDVEAGKYVMIAISDTGSGMSADVQKRIFEPFFTTKEEGEGTGLGMSMAYGFIRQCHGHIHVYSEMAIGTVFRIYLPCMEAVPGFDNLPAPAIPGGRETILVAEDDEDARQLALAMLERLGYRTLEARNGRIALELLKREHNNIDLVFTDIVMSGGIGGVELVRLMREDCPQMKVLYASGYTENAIPDYQLCAGEEFISKPFRREVLATKLRKVLDTKHAA